LKAGELYRSPALFCARSGAKPAFKRTWNEHIVTAIYLTIYHDVIQSVAIQRLGYCHLLRRISRQAELPCRLFMAAATYCIFCYSRHGKTQFIGSEATNPDQKGNLV
jgi:hypothetical protein